MSLTDDWKNGELKSGFYYVKDRFNKNPLIGAYSHYNKDHYFFNEYGGTITVKEVLAPVPSYEKLQELKHFDGKNVCAENEVLRLKVESLKDLLSECALGIYNDTFKELQKKQNLLSRIEDALDMKFWGSGKYGESEE